MRHSKALSRALSHPSGDSIRRRIAARPNPPAAGQETRPALDRAEPGASSPAGATGAARGVRSALRTVAFTTAGLLAAAGAVALFTDSVEPHGLLLASALPAVVGVLVGRRRTAHRALAALIGALLLPALLAIALAVRLSGPGPVLVRQESPHRDDRPQPPLRFRTTTTAAAPGGRLTAVGRLLRSLSLDELPGLFDVVRGDLPLPRAGSR